MDRLSIDAERQIMNSDLFHTHANIHTHIVTYASIRDLCALTKHLEAGECTSTVTYKHIYHDSTQRDYQYGTSSVV